jgi:hypothetical protein
MFQRSPAPLDGRVRLLLPGAQTTFFSPVVIAIVDHERAIHNHEWHALGILLCGEEKGAGLTPEEVERLGNPLRPIDYP